MDPDVRPLEEPLAELERQLIDEYLRGAGHDPEALRANRNETSRKLLVAAAVYAATKLTEIETRASYLREIRS